MYKILGQQVIGSTNDPQETGVGYSVYKVPSGKCATATIYVTLAQGQEQSAKNTASNTARYKIHINRSSVASNPDNITDDYGRPKLLPDGSANPLFDASSPTYLGGDEAGTLTYYPKRDNESLPDMYPNITLNDGDEIVFYNFDGRVVVQVFGLELPNNLDTEFLATMNSFQITNDSIRSLAAYIQAGNLLFNVSCGG